MPAGPRALMFAVRSNTDFGHKEKADNMSKRSNKFEKQALAVFFALVFFAIWVSPGSLELFKSHGLIGYSLPYGQIDYGYIDGALFRGFDRD